jgi:hypothetical protein
MPSNKDVLCEREDGRKGKRVIGAWMQERIKKEGRNGGRKGKEGNG